MFKNFDFGGVAKSVASNVGQAAAQQLKTEAIKQLADSGVMASIFGFVSKGTGFLDGDGLKEAVGQVGDTLNWAKEQTEQKTKSVMSEAQKIGIVHKSGDRDAEAERIFEQSGGIEKEELKVDWDTFKDLMCKD